MPHEPSDAIKLYGTEEAPVPMQTLKAGPLSVCLDQGALRYVKVHNEEAIRNIAFVVRDKDWGTYQPELSNMHIHEADGGFVIRFDARCIAGSQELKYQASIQADADGSMVFKVIYESSTGFETNRTGFVVLHPIKDVAGQAVMVEKVDGSIMTATFPDLIDPVQPFKDIRALSHKVAGFSVCCRMTGDSFEMEDHRQWNDASYKTYVRPLGLPWPYTIPAGKRFEQAVQLTLEGSSNAPVTQFQIQIDVCVVSIHRHRGFLPMPRIGLGLEPQHLQSALDKEPLLRPLGVQQLVLWHELSKHGCGELKRAKALADALHTELVLHAVIPDENYQEEVKKLAAQCQEAELSLAAISVAPAKYLKSITPGRAWPEVTPLAELYDEVRECFPGTLLGGGMLSFFPELNRHRPPTAHLDYVTHASTMITHASDDMSVMENLEAIPYIIKTCRSFSDSMPYHVGPSSIGMRFNPYGSATMANPENQRIAMARMDPRQRGLLNAAWTVGYIAHMVRGGVDCINLHAPTGEFGIIYHPQAWQQAGFDNTQRLIYPAYHCIAGFAQAAGKRQLTAHSSLSRDVEAVAYQEDAKQVIWLANLTGDTKMLMLEGLSSNRAEIARLSLETFSACTEATEGLQQSLQMGQVDALSLSPYEVVHIISDVP